MTNLTIQSEIIVLPVAPLVYLEAIGPFKETAPKVWPQFWQLAAGHFADNEITGMLGLSYIDQTKQDDAAFIYQAGITLKSLPAKMPAGLQLRELPSSRYARFLLIGSYGQLPAAYLTAFASLAKAKLSIRADFCIERYLNSPADTPEEKLQTEILIPIQ